MFKQDFLRNPIARKKSSNSVITNAIPDLAFEIGEQELSSEAGGTTQVCASVAVSIVVASIIAENISTAKGCDIKDRNWT